MSSLIQSYMNDLGLRMEFIPSPINDKVNYFLKVLETFLLCATKLGENLIMEQSLKSVLVRIDQLFSRNAQCFEVYFREGYHCDVLIDAIHKFETDIKGFEVEIYQLYTTLIDSLHLMMIDDVIEIIDSVLENLEMFHSLNFCEIGDATEALEEKMQLFRNFIQFVEMLNADQHHHFVIHIASVAINAAHVTARLCGLFDASTRNPHGWKEIEPKILALVRSIRAIDPAVSEAYKTALASSKSSMELQLSWTQDPFTTMMRGCIDFLLWCLWETLEMDSYLDDSMKDEVRPLWKVLKFWRGHAPNIDEVGRMVMCVCDAGTAIFSQHHQHSGISDLVDKFKKIEIDADLVDKFEMIDVEADLVDKFEKTEVEAAERILETSKLDSAQQVHDISVLGFLPTAVLRFLNSGLDSLMESSNFDDTLTLRLDLVYLVSSLELLVALRNQQHEGLQALWNRAKEVADSLKILCDHMVAGNIPDSLSPSVDSISRAISNFQKDFLVIYPGKRLEIIEEISGDILDSFIITEGIRTLQVDTSQILPGIGLEMEEEKVTEADLVDKFDKTEVEAVEQIPEASRMGFAQQVPDTSVLDLLPISVPRLLNSVLESLIDSRNLDDTQTLRLDLVYLISSLELLAALRNQQQEDLQALWSRANEVANSSKFLCDHLVAGNIPDSLSPSVDSISKAICIFREHFSAIYPGKMSEEISGDIQDGIRTPQVVKSQIMPGRGPEMEQEKVIEILPRRNFLATDEVVGLEDEIQSILDRLIRGSKQLRFIPIVGMAGLGKTTLALKLYNHPSATYHFHCHAWCSFSQLVNKRELLLELLSHIHPNGNDLLMNEDDLQTKLRRSLKGKRYLVFLDDVWDSKSLKWLKQSFPDDSTGSRILLTSQNSSVISGISGHEKPHFLRTLNNNESWELLQKKVFPEGNCPMKLYQLGKQIAIACEGLPLTVAIAAGLLTSPEPDIWKEVLASISSGFISRSNQFVHALELSYKHLPNYLRRCFLYIGLFSDDDVVSVKGLVWLMMAEGFVDETNKRIEDVAREYIRILEERSLVTVTKRSSLTDSKVKAFCLNDSVRGFCNDKASEENFLKLIKGHDEILGFNELCNIPRLCIQSSRRDFKNLRLSRPNVHSLLYMAHNETWHNVVHDVSFIVRVFKSLRVLHIRQIDLGKVFPGEMKLLVELRYLAVRGHFVDIPSSIGNLSKLETLIVDSNLPVVLPDTIWDLCKLRHLCIHNGIRFPVENLDDSAVLCELESCATVIIDSWDTYHKLMSKFPNVRNLKCQTLDTMILIPKSMAHVESLTVSMLGKRPGASVEHAKFEFSVSSNLRKLTLKGFELLQNGVSIIGKLSNLESLKLLEVTFHGGIFDMEGGHFQKLRFLKLSDSNVVRWTIADHEDQLPCFQKLVLHGCLCLKEIPQECLAACSTLVAMELFDCSPSVEKQVKEIEQDQRDYGIDDLKINVSRQCSSSFSGRTRKDLQ